MALFGSLSTVSAQLALSPGFGVALEYVSRCLRPESPEALRLAGLSAGVTERVELGQGVFALEQAYVSKPREQGRWEGHERYADVQVVVAGRELMGVREASALTRVEDLRAERDLMFFAEVDGGSWLRVGEGELAVFFPADGHMPSIADGLPSLVRKTVVKVPVKVV